MPSDDEKEKTTRDQWTNLWCKKTTRDRLYALGTKGETTEEILVRVIEAYEKMQKEKG